MKKSNNVPQESSMFQELEVFENKRINKDIDSVYQLLESNFGSLEDKICVCGSVAKVMHGTLAEDYKPKDVDLLIKDRFFFRFLERNIQQLNVDYRIEANRIILFFPNIVVELWKHNEAEQVTRTTGFFKHKIKYSFE